MSELTEFEKMVVRTKHQFNRRIPHKEKLEREKEIMEVLEGNESGITINTIMKAEGIKSSYSSIRGILRRLQKKGQVTMEWETMNTKYYNKFDERNRQRRMLWSFKK